MPITVTIIRHRIRAWAWERAEHEAKQLVCKSLYCFAVAAAKSAAGDLTESAEWTADAVRLSKLAVWLLAVVALWCFFDWVREVA